MGDRANVNVRDSVSDPGVFLYTHWGGSDLPEVVRVSLAKRWRWSDASYLARIIFCEMIKGDEQAETGFGISSQLQDNEHPIIVVDCHAQTVSFLEENGTVIKRWTFARYVKQNITQYGEVE